MIQKSGIIFSIAVACLIVMGLTMLASTGVWAQEETVPYAFLKKQVIFTVVGLVVAVVAALVPTSFYRDNWKIFFWISFVLLSLCYMPGVKLTLNGESRWIRIPGLGVFQPSELAKLGLMISLAGYAARNIAEIKTLVRGFVKPMVILVTIVALIFFEQDMGTAVSLGAAGFAVLFIAGVRFPYLFFSAISGLGALAFVVKHNQNRMNRIMAFMDLEAHKLDYGLQQWRAKLALGSGGIEGLGLGNGVEKHGYLPYAHTDFIFSIIGEELGLVGTLFVVFCLVLMTVSGLAIALYANDTFGRLLATGIVGSIIFPAILNIGVVTSVLPNKGIPLPFISYGGSNLIFTMAAVGVLFGIYREMNLADEKSLPALKGKKEPIRI